MAVGPTQVLRWLAAPVFCALLAGVVFLNVEATSPGPITQSHAQVPELLGAAGCDRCHGDESVSMQAACAECHTDIAAQLRGRSGIHGRLQPAAAADCGHCHKEHRGRKFQQVGERAFRLAGFADGRAGFKHEGITFELAGKHDELKCSKCHEHADDPVLLKDCKRFLGLAQDCSGCHEDPHKGKLPGCADCHGQEQPFEKVALFEHDDRFALVDSHADLSCKQCHEAGSAWSVEALGASRGEAQRQLSIRTCDACHGHHHSEPFVKGVAALAAVQPAATCGLCHAVAHADFHALDADAGRRLHQGTGFELAPPHDKAGCKDCHAGIGTALAEDPQAAIRAYTARFPGRRGADCIRCHQDPHRGRFSEDGFATATCLDCHDAKAFSPAKFTGAMHQKTRFPLTGAHQAVGCRQCHELAPGTDRQRATGADRIFAGTARECASCHQDVHDGAFARAGRARSVAGRAGCARCHDTESFRGAARKSFDHGEWTGFALQGGHAKATCEQCHPASTVATHAGTRTFGKATSTACADCHQDPHAGQFKQAGRTDCAQCHSTQAGFELTIFDHGKHSRFKLDQHHAKLACATCHKSYPTQGGGKVVRYKPLGTRCADCHGWDSIKGYRQQRRRDGR